jgi:hypothetical protein
MGWFGFHFIDFQRWARLISTDGFQNGTTPPFTFFFGVSIHPKRFLASQQEKSAVLQLVVGKSKH